MKEIEIRLQNFRAFRDTGSIALRPLTFLVGENSTGKSSFLAALNFLFRFKIESDNPGLNSSPFDLGAFDQIVHHARKATDRKDFTLSLAYMVDINKGHNLLSMLSFRPGRRPDAKDTKFCELDIKFGNIFGSPEVVEIAFRVEDNSMKIELYPKMSLKFRLSNGEEKELLAESEFLFSSKSVGRSFLNLRSFDFDVYSAIRKEREAVKESGRSEKSIEIIEQLLGAFSATLSSLPSNVFPSSPIRSTPNRVYSASDISDTPDGRGTPYRLRRAKVGDPQSWKRLQAGLTEFGRLSQLFSTLDISKLTKGEAGPFQVKVKLGARRATLADVGYGVSQSLPLIADLIEAPERAVFLFQQPEVHLHPKAQAGLGTFLSQYASNHMNSYIVAETHSDHIIDRVRLEIRRGTISSKAVSILFFEDIKSEVKVHQIELDETGSVIGAPDCYREFFLREQAAILGFDY